MATSATPTATSATTPTQTAPTTTTTAPSPTATAAPPLSPETLFAKTYDGRNLTRGREVGSTAAYQQYIATFDGDGLTISGRLLVPRGSGPFPAVVLAHGYADPAVYDNTTQMSRERDYLARQGYVVLLSTTATTPGRARTPMPTPTCGSATPSTSSTRPRPCSRTPRSSRTGSPSWAGRWAAA